MNRINFLKQTYLENIQEGLKYPNIEFVLLNYNSKDGMDKWVREKLNKYIDKGLVRYFHTKESESYHMARAKNITGRLATGEIITWIDSDNFLNAGILFDVNNNFILNDKLLMKPETGRGDNWDNGSQIHLKKEDFLRVRGYNEIFIALSVQD